MEDMQAILDLFRDVSKEGFWGNITFTFQAGKLVVVKKEQTFKLNGLDFSRTGRTQQCSKAKSG